MNHPSVTPAPAATPFKRPPQCSRCMSEHHSVANCTFTRAMGVSLDGASFDPEFRATAQPGRTFGGR